MCVDHGTCKYFPFNKLLGYRQTHIRIVTNNKYKCSMSKSVPGWVSGWMFKSPEVKGGYWDFMLSLCWPYDECFDCQKSLVRVLMAL